MTGTDAAGAQWRALVGYWCEELDHRADDTDLVRTAALLLTDPSTDHSGGVDDRVRRLVALDPLRDRPLLDDDPDGAVLVDILRAPLSAAAPRYTGAAQRVRGEDPVWRDVEPLAAVRALLRSGSIYATPECRVRLEGRARYNLAFDAAALRAVSEPSTF